MKIRLKYDAMGQSQFFKSLMALYLDNDPEMVKVVEKIKQKDKIMSKAKIKSAAKEISRGHALLKDLALTKSEIDDLFDLLEEVDSGE